MLSVNVSAETFSLTKTWNEGGQRDLVLKILNNKYEIGTDSIAIAT